MGTRSFGNLPAQNALERRISGRLKGAEAHRTHRNMSCPAF